MMIKTIHVAMVYCSIIFFVVRYVWMLGESNLLQQKWVKIAPHIIDTILLVSAIGLAIQISQYPFVDTWLTSKILALVLYIVLGTIALKRGKTKLIRISAGILAIACFGFMISVAVTKNALGFLAL